MDLMVNDLSLHGQYSDNSVFREAIRRVMVIREIARRSGRELYCHRNLLQNMAMPGILLFQAVQALTVSERRSLMPWLTQYGPFWEDSRSHGPDDWFESKNEIVTDTAIGEAAWCCLNGIGRELVSFSPSDWQFSPISVSWITGEANTTIELGNFWEPSTVEAALKNVQTRLVSWPELGKSVKLRCPDLDFSEDAFAPLIGHPFNPNAAERLSFILDTLNRLKSCFDEQGQRTQEGHEIYQNFFTGEALFSDASDSEKNDSEYRRKMTFKHPGNPGENLFCPWHGKVQTPQLRVHFSWPIRAEEPLYIVYIGPKLTKR
ncbi:hypothetical protein SAMN02949497_3559 [Methylomagnum ishizawai]|uniref:Uncharacterized protein n=1 Tax=Methylomagnum ishizawai TaxID=1760988 RepID=A0A1Y6D774_9GAMM|nr:hypothetical protein [Methylomagnum ishizawai]SMF96174.1 hypothetical protein SAMN02949497_3559 [Methylomagnum ishizawai]